MESVTKEDLIAEVLSLLQFGAISQEIALQQIKHFAQDQRVDWKV